VISVNAAVIRIHFPAGLRGSYLPAVVPIFIQHFQSSIIKLRALLHFSKVFLLSAHYGCFMEAWHEILKKIVHSCAAACCSHVRICPVAYGCLVVNIYCKSLKNQLYVFYLWNAFSNKSL